MSVGSLALQGLCWVFCKTEAALLQLLSRLYCYRLVLITNPTLIINDVWAVMQYVAIWTVMHGTINNIVTFMDDVSLEIGRIALP